MVKGALSPLTFAALLQPLLVTNATAARAGFVIEEGDLERSLAARWCRMSPANLRKRRSKMDGHAGCIPIAISPFRGAANTCGVPQNSRQIGLQQQTQKNVRALNSLKLHFLRSRSSWQQMAQKVAPTRGVAYLQVLLLPCAEFGFGFSVFAAGIRPDTLACERFQGPHRISFPFSNMVGLVGMDWE